MAEVPAASDPAVRHQAIQQNFAIRHAKQLLTGQNVAKLTEPIVRLPDNGGLFHAMGFPVVHF
jgi:hypothetical protein